MQVAQQRAAYTALLHHLGPATFAEVERALAEREPAPPETGLTPDVVAALRSRLDAQRKSRT